MRLIVMLSLFVAVTVVAKLREHRQVREGVKAGQKILLDSIK